ncbi:hypothetical protein P4133_05035 [Pseudomonas aeruginosa]|nr:hypothetical protein [Pseudomonas aeruginosa]
MATRYSASPKARQAHWRAPSNATEAMVRALAADLALKLQAAPRRHARGAGSRALHPRVPGLNESAANPGGWRRSHGAGPAQAPVGWRATTRIIHSATTVPW